ncbi:aminoacyl-tRNA hydrolase ['Camptotheca acuminata' phytoplasma]|uniref:aminoacyl-tRNA hydrolase n=1 Tax='Camptotheca acuminata' phytoplasma TaxID=3239192 RepID=UPI00351A0821
MKVIFGLGNPGLIFDNTPHNIGFMAIDFFLKNTLENNFQLKKKFASFIYQSTKKNSQILLVKPQTYMNLSGTAVKEVMKNYQLKIEDILIVYDDISLKEGVFKLKNKGRHGGHNGIKNIIEVLKTDQFKRLKIGVGNNDSLPLDKYVLNPFETQKKEIILNNFPIFNEIFEYFFEGYSLNDIFIFLNKKK